jgi:hypothetical protein
MKSVYTGLYVQKDSEGKIHTVQVYDTAGNSIPLDTETYIERNIKPDISNLPTKEEFEKDTKCK